MALLGIPNGLMGAMVGAVGRGYDYQQDRDQQQQAYQDQRARQLTKDARDQTLYDEQQEGYQHGLQRRPIIEQQEDDTRAANLKGLGLRNAVEQNTVDRIPTTNQQQDAAFDLRQKMEQHQMDMQDKEYGLHAATAGSENALRGIQLQNAQMQLSDAQAQHASNLALQHVAENIQKGDYTTLAAHYGGGNVDSGVKNADGSITFTSDGKPVKTFANDQELYGYMAQHTSPQALQAGYAAQAQMAAEQAKHPNLSNHLIEDSQGFLHNYNVETNRATPVLDSGGKPMRGTLAGHYRQDLSDPTQPAAPVSNQPQGMGAAMQQPAPAAPAVPRVQPSATGAAPPTTPQPRPLRTGTNAQGQRVVQYDDGSIRPMQ